MYSRSHNPIAAANFKEPIVSDNGRRAPVKRCTIIGWHGRRNLGDDVFLWVLANWAVKSCGMNELTIPALRENLPHLPDFPNIAIRTRNRHFGLGGAIRKHWHFAYFVRKELVVYGGGSLFRRKRWRFLRTQLDLSRRLNRFFGIQTRFLATGVSIGPYTTEADRRGARLLLSGFDQITVRDQGSLEVADDLGLSNVVLSGDLALAFHDATAIVHSQPKTPVIGFSIVDRDTEHGKPTIDSTKNKAILTSLCEVAKQFPEVEFRGFVICDDPHRGDAKTVEAMLSQLNSRGLRTRKIPYSQQPLDMIQEISRCGAIICNRMHSFVFACLTRTPAVMISYDPKMIGLAHQLNVPLPYRFSHDALSSSRLTAVLSHHLSDPAPPCSRARLDANIRQVKSDLNLLAAT